MAAEDRVEHDLATGRHIAGSTTSVIVRWVRSLLGEDGVTRLLAQAGETRPVAVLEDVDQWSSYLQATALLEAAVSVTHRPDAARRIGEEMLEQHRGTDITELLRSLGSPEALLESITASGAKFSTVFSMCAEEVSDGHAVVVGSTPAGVPRHRLLCDFTTGILSVIPAVFDLAPAVVTESECQARGGHRCVYSLTWTHDNLGGATSDQRIRGLEARLGEVQNRLLALQSTARELVAARDVTEALDLITQRAGAAVRATRYLLAVQLPFDDRPRVHADGMSADEAERLAPELLAVDGSTVAPDPTRVVVSVASTSRHYGVLAALFPPGTAFFPQEHDLLAAYAGYAATILDTSCALEEARRRNETASALLDLSRALAEVATPAEVAQRLAEAIPSVVDCDMASVMVWDPVSERLLLAGGLGVLPEMETLMRDVGVGMSDTPLLASMLASPEPLFLRLDMDDDYVQGLLVASQAVAGVVVPIVARGRFVGIVTASVRTDAARLDSSRDLLERLGGLADQAAVALTNAQLLDELQHQALHDSLTGLPNRVMLVDRLKQTLARARRDETHVALLFCDLDRFKHVNDSLGHLVGDELLVEVTHRLRSMVREADTVARLGGDEFAVLLSGLHDEGEAMRVADRIVEVISAPVALAGDEFYVTASVGVSIARCGGASSTDLLRQADDAMYAAKAAGGGVVHLSAETAPTAGGRTRLQLDAELHTAVSHRQLRVAYQPVVDLTGGLVTGAEALVRWQHPVLGHVPPADFLPLAEDTELGVDIDLWVLDRACQQLRRWVGSGFHRMQIAVNVSRRTLASPRLEAAVRRHLADAALRGRLELEITERLLDTDPETFAGYLEPLRAAGATIAIDDFGTGNSGFARLRGGLVDTLKIDRGFLAEVTDVDAAAPLLEAVIRMGQGLQLRVVAEGVEREVEREWLARAGCESAQGYLLGRPGDAAAVARRLRARVPVPRATSDAVPA